MIGHETHPLLIEIHTGQKIHPNGIGLIFRPKVRFWSFEGNPSWT